MFSNSSSESILDIVNDLGVMLVMGCIGHYERGYGDGWCLAGALKYTVADDDGRGVLHLREPVFANT